MVLGSRADAPHLQRPAPIDAYKNRGFRFAGMSHRGSLLCFPDGIWAWSVNDVTELMEATLSAVFYRAESPCFFFMWGWPRSLDIARNYTEKISRIGAFGRRDGDGRRRANTPCGKPPCRRQVNRCGRVGALDRRMGDHFKHCTTLVREVDRDRYLATLF